MEKIVPLHTLVLVAGSDPEGWFGIFPPHEVVAPAAVQHDLVGPGDRPDLSGIVAAEVRRRVALKLSLGERVVVDAHDLSRDARLGLCHLARAQGSPVIYLLGKTVPDANLLHGDGLAVVVRAGEAVRPVLPMPDDPLTALRARYRGVTVVGDIHGDRAALRNVVAWAQSRGHYLWLLGDVLDYGPDSLAVAEDTYDLVMTGRAALTLGNHERKIARWIATQESGGTPMRLSEGNRVTVEALRALSAAERGRWIGRFRSLIGRSCLIGQCGSMIFVHAAVHPHFWGGVQNPDDRAIEHYALYGETDPNTPPPGYRRSYGWVEHVPAGQTVFVGHDVRSNVAPLTVVGRAGGRTVFLDTGCGKGGRLSTADLRFGADGQLRLENFNIH